VRFCIERSWGTVRVIVSPETGLTKICIVDAGSGETEREDGDEERIMFVCDVLEGETRLGRTMMCRVFLSGG